MATEQSGYCPEAKLSSAVAAMGADERRGMRELDTLLHDYPADARLHFLKGSMLAGKQDFAAARAAMRQAVQLAPDYGVARFQLGLLLLSSGEPVEAQEAWGPLHSLPDTHPLHLFVKGLCRMIQDDFAEATRLLKEGIARNTENAPMNQDMQLVIANMAEKGGGEGGAVSPVDFLLQQSAFRPRH